MDKKNPRLKYNEIKSYREKLLEQQDNECPVCGTELLSEDAVLDHCHDTGHVRAALHRVCNTAEGKISFWLKRMRGEDRREILERLQRYWDDEYTHQPIHPTHNRKKRRRRRK